jgi:hypothetical protein
LGFDPQVVTSFFTAFRRRFEGNAVCEPRHPDRFTALANDLLAEFHISRVAALALQEHLARREDPG